MVALLTGALAAGAAHAQPLKCPEAKLDELRKYKPLPGVMNLVLPLAFIHALGRDRMADLPRKPVSFRVVDNAGNAVPNALVAIIHRATKRFLAEGATGGPAIGLPQGGYTVNAAIADKDRGVRYGSATFDLDAKGPSTVTVKLTGRADPAVPKPLVASAPAASKVSTGFDSALRESSVLAVVRQGSNVRSKDEAGDGAIVGQYEMEDRATRTFTLPGRVGTYDVVAMLCAPRIPLARWSITTTPVQIAISAPDRVPMGSTLRVTLTGATDAAAKIRLEKPRNEFGPNQEVEIEGKPEASFDVGFETGTLQITALAHDDAVLAHRSVTVERRDMAISGAETVSLGGKVDFTWPGNSGNAELEVWTIAHGKAQARRLSVVREQRLIAPVGVFELRLIKQGSFDGEGVLARKRIRIEGEAFAEAPPKEVTAGEKLEVKTTFDVEFFDQLNFRRRGVSGNEIGLGLKRIRGPRVLEITAPSQPGMYELVYRLGSVRYKVEVARVPIEVRAR